MNKVLKVFIRENGTQVLKTVREASQVVVAVVVALGVSSWLALMLTAIGYVTLLLAYGFSATENQAIITGTAIVALISLSKLTGGAWERAKFRTCWEMRYVGKEKK